MNKIVKNIIIATLIIGSLRGLVYAKPLFQKYKYVYAFKTIDAVDVESFGYKNNGTDSYVDIAKTLDVENNYRYEKKVLVYHDKQYKLIPYNDYQYWKQYLTNAKYITSLTYCNIYVWDFTRLWNAEIPHYYNNTELRANDIAKYLKDSQTWRKINYTDAISYAKNGYPVVQSYYNEGGIGHIAMVSPSSDKNMYLSQAGATNSNKLLYRPHSNDNRTYYVFMGR